MPPPRVPPVQQGGSAPDPFSLLLCLTSRFLCRLLVAVLAPASPPAGSLTRSWSHTAKAPTLSGQASLFGAQRQLDQILAAGLGRTAGGECWGCGTGRRTGGMQRKPLPLTGETQVGLRASARTDARARTHTHTPTPVEPQLHLDRDIVGGAGRNLRISHLSLQRELRWGSPWGSSWGQEVGDEFRICTLGRGGGGGGGGRVEPTAGCR